MCTSSAENRAGRRARQRARSVTGIDACPWAAHRPRPHPLRALGEAIDQFRDRIIDAMPTEEKMRRSNLELAD